MISHLFRYLVFAIFLLYLVGQAGAQISPGDLSKAHSSLEGLNNCSKCHVLGEKETTSKCLECHKEIKNLISQKKGYHASEEVNGKKCAVCHGEHLGRDFKIIKFNEKTFNHNLSGYTLEGKHTRIKCTDCHKPEFVKQKASQKSGGSWLGMDTKCLGCHEDYHQKTLSADCKSCHTNESFKPAQRFNHAKTKFPLVGKHQSVACNDCHKTEILNEKKFQRFSGVAFASCTNCHVDVHQNKFGNDCRKCHTEFSFHEVKSLGSFDHEKTDFPLRGSHRVVECKKCHTKNLTSALKFDRCTDCHIDYHEKQFVKNGVSTDCAVCHTVDKFTPSLYSIEKHNKSAFPLEGSHVATPCFSCHKKTEKWNFRNIGKQCTDCHENIHKNYLDEKYVPGGNCKSCHTLATWNTISFDHSVTSFELLGQHAKTACKSCHFREKNGNKVQQFKEFGRSCEKCHVDIHFKQFEIQGINNCERCHTFNSWKAEKFNHNNARFKLDGKHEKVACIKCHKPKNDQGRSCILYKFKDITCASCH
jgi:hypothetical protein